MGKQKSRRASHGDEKRSGVPLLEFPLTIDGFVKVLPANSLGLTAKSSLLDGATRIVLLPEDFRKAGFKAGELVGIQPQPPIQSRLLGSTFGRDDDSLERADNNGRCQSRGQTTESTTGSDGSGGGASDTSSRSSLTYRPQFAVGYVMPLQSPVLKKGLFGISQLLHDNLTRVDQTDGTKANKSGGARSSASVGKVQVRRLGECAGVVTYPLRSLQLQLIAGQSQSADTVAHMTSSPSAFYSEYRLQLLKAAVCFVVRGGLYRVGDVVNVPFEGRSHRLVVTDMECIGHSSKERQAHVGHYGGGGGGGARRSSDVDVDALSQKVADVSLSGAAGEGNEKASKVNPRRRSTGGTGQSTLLAEGGDCRLRDDVMRFYHKYNPEKVSSVDDIMTKYIGREEQLLKKLCIKYQVNYAAFVSESITDANRAQHADGDEPVVVRPGPQIRIVLGRCEPATHCVVVTEKGVAGGATDGNPNVNRTQHVEAAARRTSEEAWASVGGLAAQIKQLREAIELPLCHPEKLARYGVKPARGVLLYGPPGSGKTSLARAAAAACGVNQIVVSGPDLISRYVGESEAALVNLFRQAAAQAPCLIVLDEVDALCPRRDLAASESERRIVSTVLALMDSIDTLQQVAVVACTNRPFALDPALRRPGRLDREIEVGVPNDKQREDILHVQLRQVPHSLSCDDVSQLAAITHGFVGADLQLLVKEAVLLVLERAHPQQLQLQLQIQNGHENGQSGGGDIVAVTDTKKGDIAAARNDESTAAADVMGNETVTSVANSTSTSNSNSYNKIDVGDSGDSDVRSDLVQPLTTVTVIPTSSSGVLHFCLTKSDMLQALPNVTPSGLKEVAVEVPKVKWTDIGGQADVKQRLQEVAEWPLKHPEVFVRMGISPPRGVLLYGPPGCSKTLMARALSTESGMNFIAVKGPELLSKWLGESEQALQGIFKRARAAAPTIVFFDEIDAITSKRGAGDSAGATERVLTQLLTELDGIQPLKRVVVVAATNRPDIIDPALLRPGRLDRLVYVPPPDLASRLDILKLSLKKIPHEADALDLEDIARRTEGYSGAEVVSLCREAALAAIEEDFEAKVIEQRHLIKAMGTVVPAITPAMLAFYAHYNKR